jgi:polysaccharide biosynthesis transport protein
MGTGTKVLLALGLGLLCAAIAGAAVYLAIGERYTAYSVLHVSMQTDSVLGNRDEPLVDRDRFEIYKNTQQESLLARMVLMSALRKPEVKDIPIVQYETQYGDPVDWLAGHLSVTFPGKAEVMVVSLSLDNPKHAQTLVKAVVDSYMSDVVLAENERKQRRFDEIDGICSEKEQEIRNRREELKALVNLAGGAGAEGAESLSTKQKLVLEELALCRNERARNQFEIVKLKGELAGQTALLKELNAAPADPVELKMLIDGDPRARELAIKLANPQPGEGHDEKAVKADAKTAGEQAKTLQAQYDARVKYLSEKGREKQRAAIKRKIIELTPQLKSMEEEQDATAKKIEKLTAEAREIGQQSVDIQMIQAKLRNQDQVLANFVSERERLRVEIKSVPRVMVMESASEPLVPSNTLWRIALACLAALAGFCLPMIVLLFVSVISLLVRACR